MPTPSSKRAVVLLSGGLDSAVALATARAEGFEAYALSVDYRQRHAHELACARRVAASLGAARHAVVGVDLRALGGSALTDDAIGVPDAHTGAPSDQHEAIPVTYVPNRNMTMLSLAIGWAETLGAAEVFIGVNAVDYSGYPDCREAFIRAAEHAAALGTRAGVEGAPVLIRTPLIAMTKAEIIREGARLGVDFALTSSCYNPDPQGRACAACDSCAIRRRGFAEAGVPDPTQYAHEGAAR
ncbi:MAG: 7-cyano-7-deazaguanine synthase QueC [Phycisphaerales bacterium]|nr:MAG: 7-cyano-7-deazaguanine synthase QueC [Phycisphaerales bacterium]